MSGLFYVEFKMMTRSLPHKELEVHLHILPFHVRFGLCCFKWWRGHSLTKNLRYSWGITCYPCWKISREFARMLRFICSELSHLASICGHSRDKRSTVQIADHMSKVAAGAYPLATDGNTWMSDPDERLTFIHTRRLVAVELLVHAVWLLIGCLNLSTHRQWIEHAGW